ncbi:MAG TPA: Asp-tRNA(Asn)/Glu-tRNA(Gln) amidotransferase GatCAB subunit C [Candidatus Onthousia faecigallinarum]|nr:Asp-tRNA(Asn)/Glu-tRNA(Gln) amidotransferase GatCAB subunit C [Candidatus Onthousia faecigallinarum]
MEKEKLKDYAHKLMFDMKEEEYDTLQQEFDIILKQMDLIGEIPNIKEVEPMRFPFVTYEAKLRQDEVIDSEVLTTGEVLTNCEHVLKDQVKVPKVVE